MNGGVAQASSHSGHPGREPTSRHNLHSAIMARGTNAVQRSGFVRTLQVRRREFARARPRAVQLPVYIMWSGFSTPPDPASTAIRGCDHQSTGRCPGSLMTSDVSRTLGPRQVHWACCFGRRVDPRRRFTYSIWQAADPGSASCSRVAVDRSPVRCSPARTFGPG